jgi:hypothetical protein
LATRGSFDVTRRSTGVDQHGSESSRARIMEKLDLARKCAVSP